MDPDYALVHLLRLAGEFWSIQDVSDDLPDDLRASGHAIAANEEAWNGRAEVDGLRMVDEQSQPVAMLQSRDVLELDEPASRRYVVSVDRRAGDGIAPHAFVFRSLSVADEARRDFERNITNV
jgi:hypothetical protein